jgi:hypothetical protein
MPKAASIRVIGVVAAIVFFALTAATASAAAPYCPPDQDPEFVLGFAFMKSQLGDVMGEPLECEHPNPENGDTLQQTTTGLAFYRKATNTPTFTDGWNHWAWTADGMVQWTGDAIEPPPSFRDQYDAATITEFREMISDLGIIAKWQGPILLEVRGSPTAADIAEVDELIHEIGPLITRVAISRVQAGGNMAIYFIPRWQFSDYLDVVNPRAVGAAHPSWGLAFGEIGSAIVLVDYRLSLAARSKVLKHEVLHALGWIEHSLRPDSIMTPWLEGAIDWSPTDINLIRILYDDRITPGMTAADLTAIGLWVQSSLRTVAATTGIDGRVAAIRGTFAGTDWAISLAPAH